MWIAVFLPLLLAAPAAIGLFSQMAQVRALRARLATYEQRRVSRIGDVDLPEPGDPRWQKASPELYGERFELGCVSVRIGSGGAFSPGTVFVDHVLIGGPSLRNDETKAYCEAVRDAYANRKALEALTS